MVTPGWPRAIFGKHFKTIAFHNIPKMTSSLQDETLVSCKRNSMKSPNLGSWVSWLGPSWLPNASAVRMQLSLFCYPQPSASVPGPYLQTYLEDKIFSERITTPITKRIKTLVGNNQPATQPLLGSDFKIAQMCSAWRSSTWRAVSSPTLLTLAIFFFGIGPTLMLLQTLLVHQPTSKSHTFPSCQHCHLTPCPVAPPYHRESWK